MKKINEVLILTGLAVMCVGLFDADRVFIYIIAGLLLVIIGIRKRDTL